MPPPPQSPRPLWLDCDPGHDDALAIVLALHSPAHCRLLGVSTVASNHSLEAVTANAGAILAACGAGSGSNSGASNGAASACASVSGVPLHAGADAPLFLPPKTCPEIHGSSGLCVEGGSFVDVVRSKLRESGREELLPPPSPCSRQMSPAAAVQAMAAAIEEAAAEIELEEAREEKEEEEEERQRREAEAGGERARPGRRTRRRRRPNVALVATGALTNVALLLWTRPDLVASRSFSLYLMGGAMGQGNTGVVSEFNFEVDPHAAAAVFGLAGAGRGLEVTMVPLEVTHTALVSAAVLRRLGLEPEAAAAERRGGDGGGEAPPLAPPPPSPLRAALRSLLLYFAETYSSHFGFDAGPPLHDPLAVLAAIVPPEGDEEGEGGEGEAGQGRRDRRRVSVAFDLTRARVDVEVSSPLSTGQSVVDLRPLQLGRSSARLGGANAWVATRVDLEAMWGMLAAAIERADAASPL